MSTSEWQERQQNEIEALKSIFPEEFKLDTETPKVVWNKQLSSAFSIHIHLENEVSLNKRSPSMPSLMLNVSFPMFYPRAAPGVKLRNLQNLSTADQSKLAKVMNETVSEMIGTEMIYELVVALQTSLKSCVRSQASSSLIEERAKRLQLTTERISIEDETRQRSELELKLLREAKIKYEIENELKKIQNHDSIPASTSLQTNLVPSPLREIKFSRPLHIGVYHVSTLVMCVPICFNDTSATRPWLSYLAGVGTVVLKEYTISGQDTALLRTMESMALKVQNLASQNTNKSQSAIKIYGSTIVSENDEWKFIVAQAYVPKGSLKDLLSTIKHIPASTAKRWLANLAEELVHAHRSGVLHRDVSTSKVLLVAGDNITVASFCDWEYSHVMRSANTTLLDREARSDMMNSSPMGRTVNDVMDLCWVFFEMVSGSAERHVRAVAQFLERTDLVLDNDLKQFLADIFLTRDGEMLTASDLLSSEYLRLAYSAIGPLSAGGISTEIAGSRYSTDFDELSSIGRGGFGHVVRARNRLDGRIYAIKKVATNRESKTLREVSGLARLNHPSIVRYFASWVETAGDQSQTVLKHTSESETSEDSEDEEFNSDDFLSTSGVIFAKSDNVSSSKPSRQQDYKSSGLPWQRILFIQMEYCSGHTLRSLIDSSAIGELYWNYFTQIVDGVKYIHGQGLIHRDLKPANIFVSHDALLKLGDFGLATESVMSTAEESKILHSVEATLEEHTGEVGTFFYQAPELLTRRLTYDAKVDLYALGIIFGEMICGCATAMERVYMLKGLRTSSIDIPLNHELYMRETQLLRALLNHDPALRPSAEELFAMLPPVAHKNLLQDTLKMLREDRPFSENILSHYFSQTSKIAKYVYRADLAEFDMENSLMVERIVDKMRQIFRAHGAIDRSLQTASLFPHTDVYKSRENSVKVLDQYGNILQLPLDYKVPFARQLAMSASRVKIPPKSFIVGSVFRAEGRRTKSIVEIDFDIVSQNQPVDQDFGIEALRVLYEIVSDAPRFDKDMTRITLGHSTIATIILNQARVAESQKSRVMGLLSSLAHNSKKTTTLSWRKSLAAILPETSILELVKFLPGENAKFESELDRVLILFDKNNRVLVSELLTSLRTFSRASRTYGISLPIIFQPFPPGSSLFGLTYTLEIVSNKIEVIGVGGDYTSLVASQAMPGAAENTTKASGFSLAIESLFRAAYQTARDLPRDSARSIDVVIHAFAHKELAIDLVMKLWDARISAELCQAEEALTFCAQRNPLFLLSFKEKRMSSAITGHALRVRDLQKDNTEEVALDSIVSYLLSELAGTLKSAQRMQVPKLTRSTSSSRGEPEVVFVSHDEDRKMKSSQRGPIITKALSMVHNLVDQLREGEVTILVVDFDVEHMQMLKTFGARLMEEVTFRKVLDKIFSVVTRAHLHHTRQAVLALHEAGQAFAILYSFRTPELILLTLR